MPDSEFDYDAMVEALNNEPPRSWVVARSLGEAEAFAAWCVENDFEEPEIRVLKK